MSIKDDKKFVFEDIWELGVQTKFGSNLLQISDPTEALGSTSLDEVRKK